MGYRAAMTHHAIACAALLPLLFGCETGHFGRGEGDLGAAAASAGALFESCSPGEDDPPCQAGLRCSLVLFGEAPFQGYLTQCVPRVTAPLADDAPCALDQETSGVPGQGRKRFDRCGVDRGCVQTRDGLRCRRLCALRVPGGCDKGQICVLPTQVEAAGYCAASDGCQAVAPQKGCPAGDDGPLPCYVLTESKQEGRPGPGAGSFCVARVPLGDSDGALGSRCERSANCRAGLSCVRPQSTDELTCRPYCALPAGGPPDGGAVRCAADLGACNPIAYVDKVGRCY